MHGLRNLRFLGCLAHALDTASSTPCQILLLAVETELLNPSLNKLRIQKEAIPWMGERVSWLVLTYAVHLTVRRLMSYIYAAPILDISR